MASRTKSLAPLILLVVIATAASAASSPAATSECVECSHSHPLFPRPRHPGTPPTYIDPLPPPVMWAPPPPAKCSTDILKLGLCLDVLGGLIHVGLGPAVENYCCPLLQGVVNLEAAVCLCTVIQLKVLSLNIYIPLALEVLITCGKEPPPGVLCPL